MIPRRLAAALLLVGPLAVLPGPAAGGQRGDASPSAQPSPPAPRPEAVVTAARALAAGDAEGALAALAALPADSSDRSGAADLLQGIAALRAGRPATALAPLERAARRLPMLADLARARRADALRQAGDPPAAVLAYEALLRDAPGSPWAGEAAAALGGVRAEAGDLAGSIAADRAYLAGRPDPGLVDSVRLRLGGTLEAAGRAAEAAAVYRALVVERPFGPVAEEVAARLTRLAGAGGGAPALTNDERLTRGLILFDAYRSAEALRDLQTVDLAKLPGGDAGAQAHQVRLKRGLALFRLRRYAEAARALAQVAAAGGPVGEEARFWRARALARQGRSREAVAAFTALADGDPGGRFAGQAAYLAALVLDDQGEHARALARFRALADRAGRTPLAADALWQIAWSRYRGDDLPAAEAAFAAVAQRLPGTDAADRALYWGARTGFRLGRADEAAAKLADLVARRPLSYYGIQAARRLEESDPDAAAAAPSAARSRRGADGSARAPSADSSPPGNPGRAPARAAAEPAASSREPACCGLAPAERPAPAGLERAALLVDLGLLPEARVELAAVLKAPQAGWLVEAARLLHAAGDYSRTLAIARGVAGAPLERLELDPGRRLFPLAFPRGYRATVEAQARASRVPPHLAYAIIRAESLFDPQAVSPSGALGLMQLMPATAEDLAASFGAEKFDADLLFTPDLNVRFGVVLLGRLLARFPGRPYLAIAAYNAGAEAVARWLEAFGDLPDDEFIESIPYTETRGYVMKVLAFWRTYDELYGAARGASAGPEPAARP